MRLVVASPLVTPSPPVHLRLRLSAHRRLIPTNTASALTTATVTVTGPSHYRPALAFAITAALVLATVTATVTATATATTTINEP